MKKRLPEVLRALLLAIGVVILIILLGRLSRFLFSQNSERSAEYILKSVLVFGSHSLLVFVCLFSVYSRKAEAFYFTAFLSLLLMLDSFENYYYYSTYGYGRIEMYLYLSVLSFFTFIISVYLQNKSKKKAGV